MMDRQKQYVWLVLVMMGILVQSTLVLAYDITLVNSKDWKDVYSVAMYSNLKGQEFDFLVHETAGQDKGALIASKYRSIWLIESTPSPFVFSYGSDLALKGINVEKTTQSVDPLTLNLQLAEELPVKKFILVNPQYGSDAIAVCPYAIKTGAYVLFATPETVQSISTLLRARGETSPLVVGAVDKAVLEGLRDFSPQIVNENDRFANSIAMARMFGKVTQVTLTDADFLEHGLLKCAEPIIYLGAGEPPTQVFDFMNNEGIYIANVIGNSLFDSAQKLQAKMKASGKHFSIFMRFGQGTTISGGSVSQLIRGLDILSLPKFFLDLTIESVAWNEPVKQLEVVYDNKGGFSWVKTTIQISDEKGGILFTLGDQEPFLINAQKMEGRQYAVDLTNYRNQQLNAALTVQYGETKLSLEKLIKQDFDLTLTSAEDRSELAVESLSYADGVLKLVVQNKAGVKTYFDMLLSLGSHELREKGIIDGPRKIFLFPVDLTSNDMSSLAHLNMNYGERQAFLLKELKADIPIQTGSLPISIIVIAAVVIVLLLLIFLRKKKT